MVSMDIGKRTTPAYTLRPCHPGRLPTTLAQGTYDAILDGLRDYLEGRLTKNAAKRTSPLAQRIKYLHPGGWYVQGG